MLKYDDSVLKVSEITFIVKPLLASKIPRYRFFSVFLKYLSFGFLTVTERAPDSNYKLFQSINLKLWSLLETLSIFFHLPAGVVTSCSWRGQPIDYSCSRQHPIRVAVGQLMMPWRPHQSSASQATLLSSTTTEDRMLSPPSHSAALRWRHPPAKMRQRRWRRRRTTTKRWRHPLTAGKRVHV